MGEETEYLSESSPRQRRDSSGECCFTSGASRFRFECSGEERKTAARHPTFLFAETSLKPTYLNVDLCLRATNEKELWRDSRALLDRASGRRSGRSGGRGREGGRVFFRLPGESRLSSRCPRGQRPLWTLDIALQRKQKAKSKQTTEFTTNAEASKFTPL